MHEVSTSTDGAAPCVISLTRILNISKLSNSFEYPACRLKSKCIVVRNECHVRCRAAQYSQRLERSAVQPVCRHLSALQCGTCRAVRISGLLYGSLQCIAHLRLPLPAQPAPLPAGQPQLFTCTSCTQASALVAPRSVLLPLNFSAGV